ncbi:hypothetical protein Ahy_B07g087282 [Arachis hypogaea]|uniref:Transposase MuDR plant domain-containing protein n=1 Tax=Arachis hypogaea TaxID=3818 RepID=A0A444YBM5_ARAHY|nr:hypothetical protein Ahy_B07g087282 [Arachis hypogaea]
MQLDDIFNTSQGEDYNTDGRLEFWVGHRFRNRDAVLMVNAKHRVLELDRLKYYCHCKKFTSGCPWSLYVALHQNLNYRMVCRFGGPHTCLTPTMSQNYAQLDISLICKVILLIIKTDPFVSIPVLQSVVHQSYHFKPLYRKNHTTKYPACYNLCKNVSQFPSILDEKMWPIWYGAQLKPNPSMRRKATERLASTWL